MNEIFLLHNSIRIIFMLMLVISLVFNAGIFGYLVTKRKREFSSLIYLIVSSLTLILFLTLRTPIYIGTSEIIFDNFHYVFCILSILFAILCITRTKYYFLIAEAVFFTLNLPCFFLISGYRYVYMVIMFYQIVRIPPLFIYIVNKYEQRISFNSIFQAFDTLSEGVAIYNKYEKLSFINVSMRDFLENLQIIYLDQPSKILDKLRTFSYKTNTPTTKNRFVIKVDKSFYQINLTYRNNIIYQIILYEITEEIAVLDKLEKSIEVENAHQNRIMQTIDSAILVEKNKETVKLKGSLHDTLAQTIAITQIFMSNKEATMNMEELKEIFDSTLPNLYVEKRDDINTFINELVNSYKMLNIEVNVTGNPPEEKKYSSLISKVLRETTTNAVRHAKTNKIDIKFETNDTHYLMSIINDGIMPSEFMKGNGLDIIEKVVGYVKGNINIRISEKFEILIELPIVKSDVMIQK